MLPYSVRNLKLLRFIDAVKLGSNLIKIFIHLAVGYAFISMISCC